MNILVLGSGAREHAIAWKVRQSKRAKKIYIAPGNAGTAELGENLPINISEYSQVSDAVLHYEIELLIIGPEQPLVDGIVNQLQTDLRHEALLIIGPSREGAQLEGSKEYAKQFMHKYHIPTAPYFLATKENYNEASEYLSEQTGPFVLKVDGLASGKGVFVLDDVKEAQRTLEGVLQKNSFGKAGEKVLIEKFLKGIEVSFFVLTDGMEYVLLPEAKDYKRVGAGDTGPNTGGMGAISPVKFVDQAFEKKVIDQVITPTIRGLKEEKIPYCGFIFFGLMKVADDPYVIEYNVRLGDPETQSILSRIDSDFLELLLLAAQRKLKRKKIQLNLNVASTVVLAGKGYPGKYPIGKTITLPSEKEQGMTTIFHAATSQKEDQLIANGGRVLAVTSLGEDIKKSLEQTYRVCESIVWEDKMYRKDIGQDLIDS